MYPYMCVYVKKEDRENMLIENQFINKSYKYISKYFGHSNYLLMVWKRNVDYIFSLVKCQPVEIKEKCHVSNFHLIQLADSTPKDLQLQNALLSMEWYIP